MDAYDDLIVAETKLFRNPEARREVVAQIIDYAKDLSLFPFTKSSKRRSQEPRRRMKRGTPPGEYLQTVSSGHEDVDEKQFIDAVSRNLKKSVFSPAGRRRRNTRGNRREHCRVPQQQAGITSTLGLVALAIFELPGEIGGYLVQPRALARTQNIVRGIVTIEDGILSLNHPRIERMAAPDGTEISEEKFYEELAAKFPTIVPRLKAFAARLDTIGVRRVFGKSSMILKWQSDKDWNLGTISTSGACITGCCCSARADPLAFCI